MTAYLPPFGLLGGLGVLGLLVGLGLIVLALLRERRDDAVRAEGADTPDQNRAA